MKKATGSSSNKSLNKSGSSKQSSGSSSLSGAVPSSKKNIAESSQRASRTRSLSRTRKRTKKPGQDGLSAAAAHEAYLEKKRAEMMTKTQELTQIQATKTMQTVDSQNTPFVGTMPEMSQKDAHRLLAYKHKPIKSDVRIKSYKGESFTILRVLYHGKFGDVYEAVKDSTQTPVAIRTELSNLVFNLCELCLDVGTFGPFNFLVLQLLGPTLSDIRRNYLKKNFSRLGALFLCNNTLRAIAELHRMGFVHRKLSPNSFCSGSGHIETQIYLTGFERLHRIVDRQSKEIPKPRPRVRYCQKKLVFAPRVVHNQHDYSLRDDIESWLYICGDLFKAGLPWETRSDVEKLRDKNKLFSGTDIDPAYYHLPREMMPIVYYLAKVRHTDGVNHHFIAAIIHSYAMKYGIEINATQPDWLSKISKRLPAVRPRPQPIDQDDFLDEEGINQPCQEDLEAVVNRRVQEREKRQRLKERAVTSIKEEKYTHGVVHLAQDLYLT